MMLAITAATERLAIMRTAIVGGGPACLLLAHKLLENGASVSVYEGRDDPRIAGVLEGRAYALGLGLRGRTAIRSADDELWRKVAAQGFASDKFTLHLPFASLDLRKPDPKNEPSVLIYQSNLCSALLDALEERYGASGRLSLAFNSRVSSIDPVAGTLSTGEGSPAAGGLPFDLIAGCDGVTSEVRAAMVAASDGSVSVENTALPGSLKVVRLASMPSALAPDAVHLVPGSTGGLAAFLEPTAQGVCALISWRGGSGKQGAIDPSAISDAEAARELLSSAFPTIGEAFNSTDIGEQFVGQRVSTASTVRCSTYHLGRAVLLGDAAHSTGGASGQGCNSALGDSIALSECLLRFYRPTRVSVGPALAAYSRQRVPEGHALLDLSVGPSSRGASAPLRRLRFALSSVTDSLLSKVGLSEPPLQTLLTTSTKPFAQIRREREKLFGPFPSEEDFARMVEETVV